MGRRPNPLIASHFTRGPRIGDESNRYEYTCNHCQSIIRKGRPEILFRHLFEQCPGISVPDRESGFAEAVAQGALAGYKPTKTPKRALDQSLVLANEPQKRLRLLARETSALDTLAEVSRQQLDHSSKQLKQPSKSNAAFGQTEEEWLDRLQQQLEAANCSDHAAADPLAPPSRGKGVTNLQKGTEPRDQSSATHSHASDLASFDHHVQPEPNAETQVSPADTRLLIDPKSRTASVLPPLRDQSPMTASPPRPNSRQGRNRFSETRRKQVGEMRKLGACLRCRMLKKTCSEGTPCVPCASVVKARVWANTMFPSARDQSRSDSICTRTRFAEEMKLYDHHVLRNESASLIRTTLRGRALHEKPGRIEASLMPDADTVVTFLPMAVFADRTDGALLVSSTDHAQVPCTLMINFDADHVAMKVEHHLTANTLYLISSEKSPVIKACLDTGLLLIADHSDLWLAKVVNLWVATQILTQSLARDWTMWYSPELPPSLESRTRTPDAIEIKPTSADYKIIKAQLDDAVERYCADLSRATLKQLDQRVIERKQSLSLITYIGSALLLNCAERMSLCICQLEGPIPGLPAAETDSGKISFDQHTQQDQEPLATVEDLKPDHHRQAVAFSNLLCGALRLRRIALRIGLIPNGRGTLQIIPARRPGSDRDMIEEQEMTATKWLIATGLDMDRLRAGSEMRSYGPTDDPRAWDLSLLAHLLWPEVSL